MYRIKILKGIPTGKRGVRRTRGRWEDNIRMDLKERDQYEELK